MISSVLEPFEASRMDTRPEAGPDSTEKIQFSASGKGTVLRHYWNFCSAAGRAHEGLRAGWREHLQIVARHCGMRYLRFHGLLHDEMFVCRRESLLCCSRYSVGESSSRASSSSALRYACERLSSAGFRWPSRPSSGSSSTAAYTARPRCSSGLSDFTDSTSTSAVSSRLDHGVPDARPTRRPNAG